MRISKKILACTLSILMAISMMPFTAFAATTTVSTYQELVDAVDAFEAGTANETIKLGADIELADTITVDTANGKTLTIAGNSGKKLTLASGVGSALYIKHGAVTLNGTLNIEGAPSNYKLVYLTGSDDPDAANYSTLTLSGATINCTNGYAIMVSATANKHAYGVNVKASYTTNNVYGYYGALYVNGSIQDETGNVPNITISSGTYSANVTPYADAASALYAAGYANYTISGGTLTGAGAVYAKAGNLVITGGTLTGEGDAHTYVENGNGANPTGEALVVESNGSYAPLTVSVTGGTFNSVNAEPVGSYSNPSGGEAPSAFVKGGTFQKNGVDIPINEVTGAASADLADYITCIDGKTYYKDEIAFSITNDDDPTEVYYYKSTTQNSGTKPSDKGMVNFTLKILKDNVTLNVVNQFNFLSRSATAHYENVTIDTNGKNVTVNAAISGSNSTNSGSYSNAKATLNITGGGTIAWNPGVGAACITMTGMSNQNYFPMEVNVKGNTTINVQDGATFLNVKPNTNGSYAKGVTVNIGGITSSDKGTINATNNFAMTVNGNVKAVDDAASDVIININRYGTVTASGDNADCAIFQAGCSTLNVDGTVTGHTAIISKAGQLNVTKNAKVTGNAAAGTAAYVSISGDSGKGDGSAIILDNASGYGELQAAAISGGTIKASNGMPAVKTVAPEGTETVEPVITGGTFNPAGTSEDDISSDVTYSYTNAAGAVSYYTTAFPTTISSSGTYKLYKDATVAGRMNTGILVSNVVIDLNGHNLTVNGTTDDIGILLSRAGTAASQKTFSFINTAETPSEVNTKKCIAITGKYNNLTIGENVTLNVIDDSMAITVNGTVKETTNAPTVQIDGTVNCANGAGIYAAGYANYVINGTVTGTTGIYQKGGNLIVNDGAVVTGKGSDVDPVQNGSGFTSTGEGITVEDTTSHLYGSTVINGGTISSDNADSVGSYALASATAAGKSAPVEIIPATSTAVFSSDVSELAADGYETVYDSAKGGYVVAEEEPEVDADNASSLTLGDNITVSIYIDADAYGVDTNTAVITATYNHNAADTEADVRTDDAVALTSLPVYNSTSAADAAYDGDYIFTYECAPAQITEKCTIKLYAAEGDAASVGTIEYSAKDYCDLVNAKYDADVAAGTATAKEAELDALCDALVDYAKAAQTQFNYSGDLTDDYRNNAVTTLSSADITADANVKTDDVLGFAFDCQDELNVLVYFGGAVTPSGATINGATLYKDNISATAETKDSSNFVRVKGIGSGNINKSVTFTTANGDVTASPNAIVKAYLDSASVDTNMKNLARAIYLYGEAAATYFEA